MNWARIGDYHLNQFGVDTSQMLADFFSGKPDWATPQSETVGETARSYVVYVPSSYDDETPMPVVVVLHGRYGTGAGTASFIEINRLAEEHGIIGVYPDGLQHPDGQAGDTGWNYTKDVPYYRRPEPDDSLFLTNLIDDLAVDLNIDRERVYVTGISNGGFMVQRLACDAADVFAGFASVAATGFLGMENVCGEKQPVDMLFIHGTHDNNILWNGRTTMVQGREIYTIYPIADTIDFWADYIGCGTQADTEDLPQLGNSPETQVRVLTVDCPEGTSLVMYGIIGGGHNWPGIVGRIPSQIAGNINLDIHGTEVIWEFFEPLTLDSTSSETQDE